MCAVLDGMRVGGRELDVELLDLDVKLGAGARWPTAVEDADVVGFTCLTNAFPLVVKMASRVKQVNPSARVVLGGPHATFQAPQILKYHPDVDAVVVGEAEGTIAPLLGALLEPDGKKRDDMLCRVAGVAWRALGGAFRSTPPPDPVDLASLPLPARHKLVPVYDVANVLVNRGCTSNCSFCARQHLFRRTRVRPVESVVRELRQIVAYPNYRHVNFYDHVNLLPGFVRKLCEAIVREKISIPWGAEVRVDKLTDEEVRLMREAGCVGVATGVETADPNILERHGKANQDLGRVLAGLERAISGGLRVQAYFVVGLPGETSQTFASTLEFVESSQLRPGVDVVNFFLATPFPGSSLWERRNEFGIQDLEGDFSLYDCAHVLFSTPTLSKGEFVELAEWAAEFERNFNGGAVPKVSGP